jgi:valyl-tRNA synthetase
MTTAAGKYAGLDRFDARKQIVRDLESLGLLAKTEDHRLPLGLCQRCRTPMSRSSPSSGSPR